MQTQINEDVLVAPAEPIDMVLHCPKCGAQHIDAPDREDDPSMLAVGITHKVYDGWMNPPHRSHLCHDCGHIWRPADVSTNGVKAIKTIGKADSPVAAPVAPADGWEHLKVYGYAPGYYTARCHVCGAIANGVDKRAVTCRPCAEATHADAPAELPTTRSQRMRDAGFTHRPTWHSLPGDDEPTPTAPTHKLCSTCKGCDGAYTPVHFGRHCTGYQRERG